MANTATTTVNQTVAPPHPLKEFWFYFKENKGAVAGLGFIVFISLVAIFADVLAPHSPFEQYRDALLVTPAFQEGGSMTHP